MVMCDSRHIPDADEKLAELLHDHLGVWVAPSKIRKLVGDHWSKFSLLAHVAHDNEEKRRSKEAAEAKENSGGASLDAGIPVA
jgi:hypothetical protein